MYLYIKKKHVSIYIIYQSDVLDTRDLLILNQLIIISKNLDFA